MGPPPDGRNARSGRDRFEWSDPIFIIRHRKTLASIGQFGFELVEEFLRAFSSNAVLNLHVDIVRGRNSHHMAEAIFKGLAKALDHSCQIDGRVGGIPSSKGIL